MNKQKILEKIQALYAEKPDRNGERWTSVGDKWSTVNIFLDTEEGTVSIVDNGEETICKSAEEAAEIAAKYIAGRASHAR